MTTILDNILYSKQNKRYHEIEDIVRKFTAVYSGNSIIRDNIFSVTANYARKNDLPIELLRYPFHDNELWAFTFLKSGTVFVCVNSGLAVCRQIFALAHELYHIYCFEEDVDQNIIRNGSLLNSDIANEVSNEPEDLEANAFAGLLLMPEGCVHEQMALYGIQKQNVELDDILTLMDIFAIPYKAVVLRMYECGCLSMEKAKKLLVISSDEIEERVILTGKAKRWQLDGAGTEIFGSLLDNFNYNEQNEYLNETREKSDKAYIANLKKSYKLD